MNRHASGMSQSRERLAMDGQAGQSHGWKEDGCFASSEVRHTSTSGLHRRVIEPRLGAVRLGAVRLIDNVVI